MTTENVQLIGTLKQLFEACKDSETGYRAAVSHVRQADLKQRFQDYIEQRAGYAAELQAELEGLGAHDLKDGTIGGALHQGWAGILSAVTGGGDQAVLAECIHGEEEARKQYDEALKQDLPADVLLLVRRQAAGFDESLQRLKALARAAEAKT